jgi:hypothetical protein
MPNGYEIDIENIPYAFSKLQEAADLPTDMSSPAIYDMLYGGLSLEESIEDHRWGSGLEGDDPFNYEDIESRDPYALEKSMYQAQIKSEFGFSPPETPYGPSLEDEEAEALLNAYPGARAIMDDFDASVEGWDSRFEDVEEVLKASGRAFDDLADTAEANAIRTGNILNVNYLYEDLGEAVNAAADNDLSLRSPITDDDETNLGFPMLSVGGVGGIVGGGWNFSDIVDSVTDAAKGIGNWLKERVEFLGEAYKAGIDPSSGLPTDLLQLGLREMVEDSNLNRTLADDLERDGAYEFMQQMDDAILGPDPYHTVDQYEEFLGHLRARGDQPSELIRGLDESLTAIKNASTFPEGGSLRKTSRTDYSVTPTPGPADTTWRDYGDPASIDYGDPTEFGMDAYGPSGLGLSSYEREGPESIRELLERDVSDEGLGIKDDLVVKDDLEIKVDPTWEDKGDPRPEGQEIRIRELMLDGATREGAEYIVNEGLGPNTMINAFVLHYIMGGMSPDDALEATRELDLPGDPTGGSREQWERKTRPGQQRDDQKTDEEEKDDLKEEFRREERNRDPFTDVYRSAAEKSFYDMFMEEFNKRPASGSFGAQRLIPTMFSDVETLYHLQQTPSKRDVAYGQYYGATGDYKIKDEPDSRHVEIDSDQFPRYAQTFLNQNPFSDAFYGDVLRFRDSMNRFRGARNDSTAAQAFEGGYLVDKNNNPVMLGPGERAEDTLFHRQNFMDMGDEKARNRLATLVALYNAPVGTDRYGREKMKDDYRNTLAKWLSINRTPEDFLNAFVQPRQKRNIPEKVLPPGYPGQFPTEL